MIFALFSIANAGDAWCLLTIVVVSTLVSFVFNPPDKMTRSTHETATMRSKRGRDSANHLPNGQDTSALVTHGIKTLSVVFSRIEE